MSFRKFPKSLIAVLMNIPASELVEKEAGGEELEFQILTLWMENVINAWWAALFIYISF